MAVNDFTWLYLAAHGCTWLYTWIYLAMKWSTPVPVWVQSLFGQCPNRGGMFFVGASQSGTGWDGWDLWMLVCKEHRYALCAIGRGDTLFVNSIVCDAHNTQHLLGNSAPVQNEFHIGQCGFVGSSWGCTIEQPGRGWLAFVQHNRNPQQFRRVSTWYESRLTFVESSTSRISFVESSTKAGWLLLKALQKPFKKRVHRDNSKFCDRIALAVLPFVEDPDLSDSTAATLPQLLPPCNRANHGWKSQIESPPWRMRQETI